MRRFFKRGRAAVGDRSVSYLKTPLQRREKVLATRRFWERFRGAPRQRSRGLPRSWPAAPAQVGRPGWPPAPARWPSSSLRCKRRPQPQRPLAEQRTARFLDAYSHGLIEQPLAGDLDALDAADLDAPRLRWKLAHRWTEPTEPTKAPAVPPTERLPEQQAAADPDAAALDDPGLDALDAAQLRAAVELEALDVGRQLRPQAIERPLAEQRPLLTEATEPTKAPAHRPLRSTWTPPPSCTPPGCSTPPASMPRWESPPTWTPPASTSAPGTGAPRWESASRWESAPCPSCACTADRTDKSPGPAAPAPDRTEQPDRGGPGRPRPNRYHHSQRPERAAVDYDAQPPAPHRPAPSSTSATAGPVRGGLGPPSPSSPPRWESAELRTARLLDAPGPSPPAARPRWTWTRRARYPAPPPRPERLQQTESPLAEQSTGPVTRCPGLDAVAAAALDAQRPGLTAPSCGSATAGPSRRPAGRSVDASPPRLAAQAGPQRPLADISPAAEQHSGGPRRQQLAKHAVGLRCHLSWIVLGCRSWLPLHICLSKMKNRQRLACPFSFLALPVDRRASFPCPRYWQKRPR